MLPLHSVILHDAHAPGLHVQTKCAVVFGTISVSISLAIVL